MSSSRDGKDTLGYPQIKFNGKPYPGVFRMAVHLWGWKRNEDVKVRHCSQLPKVIGKREQIDAIQWMQTTPKEGCLYIYTKEEGMMRFSGFKEEDFTAISNFAKHQWGLSTSRLKSSTRGWSWGEYEVTDDDVFHFSTNKERLFKLQCQDIKNVQKQDRNKTDITIGFESDEEANCAGTQMVTSMTFFVPQSPDDEDPSANLTYLHDTLQAKCAIKDKETDVVLIAPYINMASPPGRFDLQILRDGMKLSGKTAYFRIAWRQIADMYYLPSSPTSYVFLELRQPLKKGNTTYKSTVLQIDQAMMGSEYKLCLKPEDEGLTKAMNISGPPLEGEFILTASMKEDGLTLPRIMSCYAGITPKQPHVDTFQSSHGKMSIPAYYKTNNGKIFLMDKALLFLPKPPTIFHHDEIAHIDFRRIGGGQRTRNFGFMLYLKNKGTEHDFSGMDRAEYDVVMNYFIKSGIKVLSGDLDDGNDNQNEGAQDDHDEDDDSSDDSNFDENANENDAGSDDDSSDSGSGSHEDDDA